MANYSLKRTAAYRRLCYHAATRQRPLSSSVRLGWGKCFGRVALAVSSRSVPSPGARSVCGFAFLHVYFVLAGLRVVHFSSFRRARRKSCDIMRLRARSRAGHYPSRSHGRWQRGVGKVTSIVACWLCSEQALRPNCSLKRDGCGLVAVLSNPSRRSRPLAQALGSTWHRIPSSQCRYS